MKIYGYQEADVENDGLLQLEEITIQASPVTLKQIAQFLIDSANAMDAHGEKFGHEHFNDFMQKIGKYTGPDIIVSK